MSDHAVAPSFTSATRKDSVASSAEASSEERQAALDSASGHLRMEGMSASAFTTELDARFVAGEIDALEMIRAIKAHYKVPA